MEGLVSVGLAGIFIAILSSMLSENLRMGPATYNDLVANQILNNLEEGALTSSYDALSSQITSNPPLVAVATGKNPNESLLPSSKVRRIPIQLDLTNPNLKWGSLDRNSKTLDLSNAWSGDKGNYFKGSVFEAIEDGTPETSIPSVKITYTVTFNDSSNASSPGRKRSRVMYVFQ